MLDILRKFADDTKGAKSITCPEDREVLQKALDDMLSWGEKWGMNYNIDKCKVMHCGRGNPCYSYSMDGKELKTVTDEKDIGVNISDSLKPSTQCLQAANRAKAVLTQIFKCFHYRDKHVYIRLYKQFVRPHLEFSSSVWSPWTVNDINCLEDVQRKAVKMVSGLNSNDYDERLKELGLWRLEKRRKMADLVQCFKIVKRIGNVKSGFVHVQNPEDQGRNRPQTRTFADPLNLKKQRCKLDIRKNFFTCRVADWWNELPHDIKHADTVATFKRRLVERMNQTSDTN